MSTRLDFDDFPGLFQAERQVAETVKVLRAAIKQLGGEVPEGGWAARAGQLRQVASSVQAAALELATCAGWNAAAGTAGGAGREVEDDG